jgi:WD40 repeat protein
VGRDDWFFEADGRSVVALNLPVVSADSTGEVVRLGGRMFDQRHVLFEVEPGVVPFAAFSNSRRFLGVGHLDGRAVVWDVDLGKKLHEKQIGAGPVGILLVRNDGTVLLGHYNAEGTGFAIADWDLTQPNPGWSGVFKTGAFPFGAESNDGKWFLRTHHAQGQRAWLMNQKLGESGVPVDGVGVSEWAGFSPDGTYFAVDGTFQNGVIFETATRQPVLPISDNLPKIRGGAFSPDNRRFAAGGMEVNGFTLWDFQTGQVVLSFANTGLSYYGVQFSSDGKLIGAQSEGKLHLWRAPTWEEIRRADESENLPGQSLAF